MYRGQADWTGLCRGVREKPSKVTLGFLLEQSLDAAHILEPDRRKEGRSVGGREVRRGHMQAVLKWATLGHSCRADLELKVTSELQMQTGAPSAWRQ